MVVAALRTARQRPVARIQTLAADSLETFVGGTDGRPAAALAARYLISPIAMDEGLRFAIREGGRTVGAGVVSKIVE